MNVLIKCGVLKITSSVGVLCKFREAIRCTFMTSRWHHLSALPSMPRSPLVLLGRSADLSGFSAVTRRFSRAALGLWDPAAWSI